MLYELRYHAFCLISPGVSEQAPGIRVSQHIDEDIAILIGQTTEVEEFGGGRIPHQEVPSASGDISGLIQTLHQAADHSGHALTGEYAALSAPCQNL